MNAMNDKDDSDRRSPGSVRSVIIAASVFFAGLALTYRITYLQYKTDLNTQRDQISFRIEQGRNNLSRELYANINLTQGLVDLLSIQGGIDRKEFEAMANGLISHSTMIQNIAVAPDNTIRMIYPMKGNEKALGLNYMKTPGQGEAVRRCMSEKRTVVAGPIRLVQGGVGIIGRSPVYLAGTKSTGKYREYWGVVSTVINFDSLLKSAQFEKILPTVKLALRGRDGTGSQGAFFWGDSTVFGADPVWTDIALPSGSWQLAAIPFDGWMAFNLPTSILSGFGFFISIVLSILLFQVLQSSSDRAKEINRRRITEDTLRQKNRALRLFSECNGAVVQATHENDLLTQICRIAVDFAGYRMAWIGKAEHDAAKTVRPVTWAGSAEGFLDKVFVSWAENDYGRGTAGTAIRTRKPAIGRDLLKNTNFSVWREAFALRDYASAIAVPLMVENEVYGALLIYAAEPDAFDSTEVELLEELGSNISHGITAIRFQKERREAFAALENARNELEERVAERTKELVRAKEAAESADRIKSAFLATMSHELRTPLNSIIGFTGVLIKELAGPLNPEQRKQLGMVQNSARHLLALINDVLDISKIEAGQLEVKNSPFDLVESITNVVQTVQPLADRKELEIVTILPDDVGTVVSDKRRVEQILMNLLSNAIKFTEKGGVKVRCWSENGFVRVSVTDSGIGIAPQNLETIFTPFYQIDNGLTRKHEGTGLGLSICRRLLDLLGGSIDVRSIPGTGSTFTMNLPYLRASA